MVVRVPPGHAVLGTNEPHFPADAEAPAFNYTQERELYVDKYEVDNARFKAFVDATRYATEAEMFGWSFVHELAIPAATLAGINQSVAGAEWWLPVNGAIWSAPEGPESGIAERMDHPVVHVSLRDSERFCAWAGGRLPTENEWEYSARGGKQERLFSWGNLLYGKGASGERVHRTNIWQGVFPYNNTREDGHAWAAPVQSFGPQNAWGLHHVSGNVWEWTSTRWCPGDTEHADAKRHGYRARMPPECARQELARRRSRQPEDPGEVDHVKKGGSFLCHIKSCYRYRVAARHKNTANSSAYNLGFRCVYDTPPKGAAVERH